MAARDRAVWDESFNTTTDLSAKQFYAVKMSALDTVALAAAATDRCIGILQNDPKANQACDVRILGMTKAVSDGSGTAIAVGDLVGPDSTGKMIKKATADYNVMGIAMDASSASGTVIGVAMTPMALWRTTLG